MAGLLTEHLRHLTAPVDSHDMAQKEEEDLKRWKETNRPQYVQEAPERLGGNVTMAQAREKQFISAQSSKLQKKLKKQDADKRRRQEEEEELQKMKAEQRSVAERQQEKTQQEEQRRREQLREDHLRTNDSFLQRFDRTAPAPWPSGSATHTPSGGEQSVSRQSQRSCVKAYVQEVLPSSQYLVHEQSSAPGQQSALYPDPEPEESCWEHEADPELDYDRALMKLMDNFPDFARVFLEDILDQCHGDYMQAYTLLSCTLS
ncbi:uncharacterized protein V6R79_010509 [Siganus canaliculatus]